MFVEHLRRLVPIITSVITTTVLTASHSPGSLFSIDVNTKKKKACQVITKHKVLYPKDVPVVLNIDKAFLLSYKVLIQESLSANDI